VFKRIRVKPLGYIVLSTTGLLIAFLIASAISPRDRNQGFRWFVNKTVGKECITYRQQIYSRKLKDMLPDYVARSSAAGISICDDKKDLLRKAAGGELFRITNGRGYVIENLSYSYPYLTNSGKELLKEIGRRFRKKIYGTTLRGSSFRITSMTRTNEIFRTLKKSNINASENSPHFYGNAFDISYVRFSAKKWFVTDCDKYYLKEALAEVIWQLRQEQKCWATYEINQGCFHVVAM
jgi:Family of unknown function (DUF5715)